MTREKAKNDLHQKLYMDILNIGKFIDSIYDSLEAKIAELESEKQQTIPFLTIVENETLRERIAELEAPKTCDGCKYYSPEDDENYEHCTKVGTECKRWNIDLPDYYEPKDTND